MADPIEIRIMDALADYVQDNIDLPPHNVIRYERPPAVLPEMCPLLVIWWVNKVYTPKTTDLFDNRIIIGVSWQVTDVQRATTLLEDSARAKENIINVDKLQQGLRDLCVNGWTAGESVLEAYDLIPISVDPEPPMTLDTGLVRGYSMAVQVMTVERGIRT